MTYPPQPEPFAEALGEAAHTAAMAYRLMMTITDAVRRAVQKRITGKEEELSEDAEKMAPGWSADQLRGVLGDDILAELMAGADWPVMACQQRPPAGRSRPRHVSAADGPHDRRSPPGRRREHRADEGRGHRPVSRPPEGDDARGMVRDAILSSPAWPDIAAAMGRLDAKGIDVARILLDAHAAGAGVDQAVAAVTTAAAAKAPAPAPATPAATAAPAPDPASADARLPAPAPAPGTTPAAAAAPLRDAVDPWAPPLPPRLLLFLLLWLRRLLQPRRWR